MVGPGLAGDSTVGDMVTTLDAWTYRLISLTAVLRPIELPMSGMTS
jgi:hypothetical protein